MNDAEVIEGFLGGFDGSMFSPSLHVERGSLLVDGWWAIALRVCDGTVIVRNEPVPSDSSVLEDLNAALAAQGLSAVATDLPAMVHLTYTSLDLGYAPWVLWSTDRTTGEADINAKVTEESFLVGGAELVPILADDNLAVRGARRTAGAPTGVLLVVGVVDSVVALLATNLDDCRIEARPLETFEPGQCAALFPTVVLVDATGAAGKTFVVDLQDCAEATWPVVAITDDGEMLPGADATVDTFDTPDCWVPLLHQFL